MHSKHMIGVVFVIGCVAGGAASQVVVPKARAGTPAPHWQYFCMTSDHLAVEDLNKAGQQGWELTSTFATKLEHPGISGSFEATAFAYCFKQPAP